AAVTLGLVRGTVPLWAAFSWEGWKPLLRMIAPYATAVAVSSIYVYLAAVVMSLVASDVEVGLFSAAFRVFIVIGGIPLLLVGSAFPILARAARDEAAVRDLGARRRLVRAHGPGRRAGDHRRHRRRRRLRRRRERAAHPVRR